MRQYILNALLLMAFPTLMQAQVLKLYYRMDAKIFQPTEVKEISGIDSITLAKDRNGRFNNYFYAKGVEGTATTYGSFEEVGSMRVVSVTDQRTIWDALTEAGNYTYFQRMIDDYDKLQPAAEGQRSMREILSGWNDGEVYAANDAAWEVFFAENAKLPEGHPWHNATSYDRLSDAQKMMLAASSNTPSYGESEARTYAKGLFLRNNALFSPTENVIQIQESDMPHTYSTTEKDYWARFRTENGGKGHILLGDFESPMTTIITKEWCQKNAVREGDFAIITGNKQSDLSKMNNAKVVNELETDNGAVNSVSRPIVPLANMAEVIRTNGRTNIFSHILDRFSAPFYDETLTQAMRDEMSNKGISWEDSVFVKRYFSTLSCGHNELNSEPGPDNTLVPYNPYKDESGTGYIRTLKFDPAWNGYYDEARPEEDIAAMYVPSDAAMWRFFTEGIGKSLIMTYTTPTEAYANTDSLFSAIDQIPVSIMQTFVNTIMMRSFRGSVPSKMTSVLGEGMDQVFYPEDAEKIDTCLLASNGAVYVMDEVYGPADYTAVIAPAYINNTNKIIKWAIYDGSTGSDYMKTYFYTYLKAPQTNLTFFLPSDEAMQYCYDPTSFESTTKRLIQFGYKNQAFPITSKCINYDPATGVIGRAITGQGAAISTGTGSETTNRLKDILESHTIVHNIDSGQDNIRGENEYFLTKNGNAVKVIRDAEGHIVQALGGFQLENQRQNITSEHPGIETCNITKAFEGLKNGQTYILDAPLIPTYRSVYSILTNDEGYQGKTDEEWYAEDPYAKFFQLCECDENIVYRCGLVPLKDPKTGQNTSTSERNSGIKKFRIFGDASSGLYGLDKNVQFFNNYHYTVFVPTNEAVQAAIDNGLPTWEEIAADDSAMQVVTDQLDSLRAVLDAPDYVPTAADSALYNTLFPQAQKDSVMLQAKITYLTNFIRYHFFDNTVFLDKMAMEEREFVTSSYDNENGLFCKAHVKRVKEGGQSVLYVCDDARVLDANGNKTSTLIHNWIPTTGEPNVMARDIICSSTPVGVPMSTSSKKITLDASSTAVIHSIGQTLNHTALVGGRHDSQWATMGAAKKYLKRFGVIRDTH